MKPCFTGSKTSGHPCREQSPLSVWGGGIISWTWNPFTAVVSGVQAPCVLRSGICKHTETRLNLASNAEQIVVPADLADILKAYTKEVIRRQPENLIEFSAK
eukprot:1155435-Pelagomonas_calceolata.AAC.1